MSKTQLTKLSKKRLVRMVLARDRELERLRDGIDKVMNVIYLGDISTRADGKGSSPDGLDDSKLSKVG